MKRAICLTHDGFSGIASALAVSAVSGDGGGFDTQFVRPEQVGQALLSLLTDAQNRGRRVCLAGVSFRAPSEPGAAVSDVLADKWLPAAVQDFVGSGGELVVIDGSPEAEGVHAHYSELLHPESLIVGTDGQGCRLPGVEVAARYFRSRGGYHSLGSFIEAAEDRAMSALCAVAAEYETWHHPLKLGGQLEIATAIMSNPHLVLRDLVASYDSAIYGVMESTAPGAGPFRLRHHIQGGLKRCLGMAKAWLTAETQMALSSGRRHSETVIEINATRFPDLLAESVHRQANTAVMAREGASDTYWIRLPSHTSLDLTFLGATTWGNGSPRPMKVKLSSGRFRSDLIDALVALG